MHAYLRRGTTVLRVFLRWLLLASLVGLIVGAAASVFGKLLSAVNLFRTSNPWIILGLPIGGLLIVLLYHIAKDADDRGTNTVILSLRGNTDIPFRMTPLIFCSTVLTHLFGGSAGREGAALQLGGSIANRLGKCIRLSEEDRHILVMCGMSAGFSALFGTPIAAALFSLEVVSVGILQYSALVPCAIASLVGHFIAILFKLPPEQFPVSTVPTMDSLVLLRVVLLAVFFALVSIAFCTILHGTEHLLERRIRNQYVRICAAAVLILGITMLLGTGDYLGSGIHLIEQVFHHNESLPPYAFLLKIIFTALTLGAGFKGGEIVPSLTIGAAAGCALAALFGLPMTLAAACGMAGVFCGVTNCPMTSFLIALELFGSAGMPYYFVTVAVTYTLSGFGGLYRTQHIVDAKLRPQLTKEPRSNES